MRLQQEPAPAWDTSRLSRSDRWRGARFAFCGTRYALRGTRFAALATGALLLGLAMQARAQPEGPASGPPANSGAAAQEERPERPPDHADIAYATVEGMPLTLDLYLPEAAGAAPLVVWIHGGAWRFGSKANPPLNFVESGFAMASLDFRQSPQARFPAMVHDIKAAIRFLRANAQQFGYDAERIAVAGVSSGGHLAALVGVTNGHAELEGELGEHRDESSAVQAIVTYSGASNLTTILQQSTPLGLRVREPALDLLLGGAPDTAVEIARLASPVFHVDAGDPPLHILHGDQDPQMPINQAHELHGAYKQLDLDVYFDVVHGAGHGGSAFYNNEHWGRTAQFLMRVLGPNAAPR